jgi:hypothetical protein
MNSLLIFVKSLARKLRINKFLKLFLINKNKETDWASLQQQIQKNIESQWLSLIKNNLKVFDKIQDAGFRCYSQFEEDGIILYLLACIGKKTRSVVEICCGSGSESMAANLIINHGYKGYLFDGDEKNVNAAKSFFSSQKDCMFNLPSIKKQWITKNNVNQTLIDSGIQGEVDVLSLDIDGNDYYIWEEINVINPRVCVFETHSIVPSNLSITIPYKDDFYAMDKDKIEREFRSASLLAMVKLSKKKGYTMVGSHKHGFNVFFVRDDLLNDLLPRPTIEEIHDNECTRVAQKTRWPLVKNYPWVKVD